MSEEQEQHWHYIVDGEQYGPVGPEELQQLANAGSITPDTQVWTESLENWLSASHIEGLFPSEAAPQGPRLITGAAAQTASPLASAPSPAPAAAVQPVAPTVAEAPVPAAGFALGGSLAGGPHAHTLGAGAALAPGHEQRFQIRSIGALQAGVVAALLFAITIFIIMLLIMIFGGMLAAATGDSELVGALAGGGLMLFIAPILYGIFGFFYGMIAALIYNLAAKMCGGLIVKVEAKGSW